MTVGGVLITLLRITYCALIVLSTYAMALEPGVFHYLIFGAIVIVATASLVDSL